MFIHPHHQFPFATTALVQRPLLAKSSNSSCCIRWISVCLFKLDMVLVSSCSWTWNSTVCLCFSTFAFSLLQCISPPYQIWNYFQVERFALVLVWNSPNSHFNLFSTRVLPLVSNSNSLSQCYFTEHLKNIICYFNSSPIDVVVTFAVIAQSGSTRLDPFWPVS